MTQDWGMIDLSSIIPEGAIPIIKDNKLVGYIQSDEPNKPNELERGVELSEEGEKE